MYTKTVTTACKVLAVEDLAVYANVNTYNVFHTYYLVVTSQSKIMHDYRRALKIQLGLYVLVEKWDSWRCMYM